MIEELMFANKPRRRKHHATRTHKKRHSFSMNAPKRRRHSRRSFVSGGSSIMSTGVNVGDFVGLGAGGVTAVIVPKMFNATKTGWMNIAGSGVTAIAGGWAVKKFVSHRIGNAFVMGGLTVTAVKILQKTGIMGKVSAISGLDDFGDDELGSVTEVSGLGLDDVSDDEMVL